jgi:hypothetical protein
MIGLKVTKEKGEMKNENEIRKSNDNDSNTSDGYGFDGL